MENQIEFYPLWDYVLIEPIVVNKTEKGLMLPEGSRQDDMQLGKVVKSGPGACRESGTFIANPIKVGDVIYFMSMRHPFKVMLKGKLYF